ncbi:TraR/DksA family transcriptional regulator [Dermacoccaceae bacterium W4C1]
MTKAKTAPGVLRVGKDETPWTEAELAEVRAELKAEQDRITAELSGIAEGLQSLMLDSGEGSGDDEVDAGAKTSNREQEFTVAENSRLLLVEVEQALQAIDDGTYGTCENCGNPIGKLRMQARPRTTLCMACKQKQERR